MLPTSDYFSGKHFRITRIVVRLLLIVVLCIPGSSNASKLKCTGQGKQRACEILEAVPAAPHEEGHPRDMNFSSPSKQLLERLKQSGNDTTLEQEEGRSTFEVTIVGSASPEQKTAIDFCMDRAAENWISSVPVRVLVRFEDLGVQNLLGSAQPSRNWIVRDFICPVALAEAVLGRDLNNETTSDLRYDIWMTLNSKARWYTGTDAQAPLGRYDLVTVCLHETYHGLLMSGGNIGINAEEDGSYKAFFYSSRYTGRFDAFMANQDECQIIGYAGNDTSLGAVLTGNNLWFAEGKRRVGRLHAPRPFTIGSSLYHLSEWEYGEGTDDNDLMTPAIGSNYAQHNAGEVLTEMQRVALDVDGKAGAEVCAVLRDPQEGDGLINQGNGGGGGGEGEGEGEGGDGGKKDSGGGFTITLGNSEVSGWIVVGAGVGAAVVLALVVGVGVRASVLEKRRAGAARKERRRRRAQERIDFEAGNGGGVV